MSEQWISTQINERVAAAEREKRRALRRSVWTMGGCFAVLAVGIMLLAAAVGAGFALAQRWFGV